LKQDKQDKQDIALRRQIEQKVMLAVRKAMLKTTAGISVIKASRPPIPSTHHPIYPPIYPLISSRIE
jgi:hypothetical protein